MGRLAPRRGIAWTVVAGLALYEFLLLSLGLLLGYLGLLRAPVPLILWSLVTVVLLALAVRGFGALRRAARGAMAGVRLRPMDAGIGLAALMMAYLIGLQIVRDWTHGTVDFDSLSYHVPRALLWTWHGDFRPWPAAVWQQIGLPIGGDVLLVPGVLLGMGWLGGAWTTVWLSLAAACAVFAATRNLGAGRRASLLAAIAFLSFPAVGGRLTAVSSDAAAAFPLLAAWVLGVHAGTLAEGAFLFLALGGVGIAAKAPVAPAVLVLAIALLGNRFREFFRDRRAIVAAAAGTLLAGLLCVGSFLPVYRAFGDLVGGDEGRSLVSFRQGFAGASQAALFGTLHWLIEPFALVPETPRFDLLDRLGIGRAYTALGAGPRFKWYPSIDPATNRSGVFPLLALPWLIAALPKGQRIRGGLVFLALLLVTFTPVSPNTFASRFAVVLLAAFAVLWGLRAARSPGLVAVLLVAALIVDAGMLRWNVWPERSSAWARDRNANIAKAVGSQTLWLLSGGISSDAQIAGLHADVRFEYVTCPADRDWVRRFTEIRGTSPWLLLNVNVEKLGTGPAYRSVFGPPCPGVPTGDLQGALAAAGWHLAFEEYGYQIWSGEPQQEPGRS